MLTLSQSSAGSGPLSQQTAQPQPQQQQQQQPQPLPPDPRIGSSSSPSSAPPPAATSSSTSSSLFVLAQSITMASQNNASNSTGAKTISNSGNAFALSELDVDPIFEDSDDEDDDPDFLEIMQKQTADEQKKEQTAINAAVSTPSSQLPARTPPPEEAHTSSQQPAPLPPSHPPIPTQPALEQDISQEQQAQAPMSQAASTARTEPLPPKVTSASQTSHTLVNGTAAPSAPTSAVPNFSDVFRAFLKDDISASSASAPAAASVSSVVRTSPVLPPANRSQVQGTTASPALTTPAFVWQPNRITASPSPAAETAGPSRLRLSASPVMEDEPSNPAPPSSLQAPDPPPPSSETVLPPSTPQIPNPSSPPPNGKGKAREDGIPQAKMELDSDDDFVITAVTSPEASKKPTSPVKRERGRPRASSSATSNLRSTAVFGSQQNGNPSPSKRAAPKVDFLARVEDTVRPEPVTAAQRFWDGLTVLHDEDRRIEAPSPLEHLCSILGRGDLLDIAPINLPVYRATSAKLHTVLEVNTRSAKLLDRTLTKRPGLASNCRIFRIWQDSAFDETAKTRLDWDYVKDIARLMDKRLEEEDGFQFELFLGMLSLPELMNALRGETIDGHVYSGCSRLASTLTKLTLGQDCDPANFRYEKGWSGLRDLLFLLGGQTKVISSVEEFNMMSRNDNIADKNVSVPHLKETKDRLSYQWPNLRRMCLTVQDKSHFQLLDGIDVPNLVNLAIDATTEHMDGDWDVTALDHLLKASPGLESISVQLNEGKQYCGSLLNSYHPQLRNFKFIAGEQFMSNLDQFLARHQVTIISLECGKLCYRMRSLADPTNRFDQLRLLDYRSVPEKISVKVPPLNLAHVAIAYDRIKPKLLSSSKARGNGPIVRPIGAATLAGHGRRHADPDLNANAAGDKERLYKEEIPECFEVRTLVSITSLELLFDIYKLPELTTEIHMMINSRIFPNLLELKLIGEREGNKHEPLYFKQTMLQQLLVAVADSLTLRAVSFENFCTVIPPYEFLGRYSVFGPSLEYVAVRTVAACARVWRITRDVSQDSETRLVGNSRADTSRLDYVHRPVTSVVGIPTDDFQFAFMINDAPADAWQKVSFYSHWNDEEREALLEKTRRSANLGTLPGAATHPPERPSNRKQKVDPMSLDGLEEGNSSLTSPIRRAATQRNAARKAAEATTQLFSASQPVARATRATQLRARMEQAYRSSQPNNSAQASQRRILKHDDIFGEGLDDDDDDDDDGDTEEERSTVEDEDMEAADEDQEQEAPATASQEPRWKTEAVARQMPAATPASGLAAESSRTARSDSQNGASTPRPSSPKRGPATNGAPASFPFHNAQFESSDSESDDDDGRPRTGGKAWLPGQSARRSTGGKQAPPGFQPPPPIIPRASQSQPRPTSPVPARPQPTLYKSPASTVASSQPAPAQSSSDPVNGETRALSQAPAEVEAPPVSQRHSSSVQGSTQFTAATASQTTVRNEDSPVFTPTPARSSAARIRQRSSSPAGDPAASSGLRSPAKKPRRSAGGENGLIIPTILSRSSSPMLPGRTEEERILIEDARSVLAGSQSYRRGRSPPNGAGSDEPGSSRSSRSLSPKQRHNKHQPHSNGSSKFPPGLGKSIEVARAIHQDVVDLTSSPEPEDRTTRTGERRSPKRVNRTPSQTPSQPRRKDGRFSRTSPQPAAPTNDDDESDWFRIL
ncbi:hypothetical protein OC845_003455 [Tilletia horrida]|nr:hypothetical protein OC845_003455 [Tilletia horrida]